MECKTKEITVTLIQDQIVKTAVNENITELTLEGVDEVIAATNKVYLSNDKPKVALICAPSFYIKKDVLKGYAANREVEALAVAIVTPSFGSQIMGNLLLTLRGRVLALSNDKIEPSKVFRDEKKAIKWLLGHLGVAEER
ncbi:hypothetical protein [Aureispira anguillae]|uniref:Uncharacterized protein n=1 Tax=Aureispira anguillae TaxID=2864201 RepID=A0A916DR88_9BACT|nr:hypothetical protein [Aureispira anguillae]BDS10510.1 hypothetical protein AsAng_0012180 [Aureispira anguillae]